MNKILSLFFLALALTAAGICQFAASCAWADDSRPTLCKIDIIVNSENRGNEAFRACDGNLHTFWHTRFDAPAVDPPHWIALDLLEPMTVEGFDYTPREDLTNGTFENVKVYVCDSLEDKGEPVWTGVVYPKYEKPVKTVRINFPAPATGRYIFFDVVNALSNIARASAAEIQPIVKGKVFLHKDIVEFYENLGINPDLVIQNGLIAPRLVNQSVLSVKALPKGIVKNADGVEVEPRFMMHEWMLTLLDKAEQRWIENYEKAKTPEQIAQYQKERKDFFFKQIGAFPERNPLNPVVTGTVQKEGYTVEKVRFESQPNFWVTANLFLPDETKYPKPWPGVLVACGHSANGKGYAAYQRVSALLALNGMAALIFDPIDQGERYQFTTPHPPISVHAHNLLGIGSMALGRNTSWFEIWDGMRGIDYLQSRPDVNPEMIGACGLSGGGTQTAYFMALDERIDVAASLCYLTSLTGMYRRGLPESDAEQHVFGQLEFGLEHADYCIMRAPKPTMIGCATKDFFPIKQTWESYRYSKRMFGLLGVPERMTLAETFNTHGYDLRLREATARFMHRFLVGGSEAVVGSNKTDPIVEPKGTLELSEKEYLVTETGNVQDIPGSRTTFDINRDYAKELAAKRAEIWSQTPEEELRTKVRQQALFQESKAIPPLAVLSSEDVPELTTAAEGQTPALAEAKRIVFQVEPKLYLTALWLVPRNADMSKATLFVSDKGKTDGLDIVNGLLENGKPVLTVDLRGYGETQQLNQRYFNLHHFGQDGWDCYFAFDLNKTYVGFRAEDLYNLSRYLKTELKATNVDCIAVNEATIPALHAEFCEPETFGHLTVVNTLVSWTNMVENGGYSTTPLSSVVHGALQLYDLPELRAALEKSGKLTVFGLRWEKKPEPQE